MKKFINELIYGPVAIVSNFLNIIKKKKNLCIQTAVTTKNDVSSSNRKLK